MEQSELIHQTVVNLLLLENTVSRGRLVAHLRACINHKKDEDFEYVIDSLVRNKKLLEYTLSGDIFYHLPYVL